MKKVLILAYDFPPYVSVAGLRPKAWLDEFINHDFHPTIITRQWSFKHQNPLDFVEASEHKMTIREELENGTVLRTPYTPNLSNRLLLKHGPNRYRLLRKSITAFYEITQYFFKIGPKANLYKEANAFLKENKVDVIIATGEPFVLFSYAAKLSKRHDTPWVADYRDIWSELNKQNFLLAQFHKTLERKICSQANAITTVSTFVKNSIFQITQNSNIHVFPNGFDAKNMEKVNAIEQKSDVLRIGLAGTIQPWNPHESFLKSVQQFHEKYPDKKIEFHFIGLNIEDQFNTLLRSKFPSIEHMFSIHQKMQNLELLKQLTEFNALLLFNNFCFMGTKIYDYLGLKRTIISCFSDDKEGNKLKSKYFPIENKTTESETLQEDLILKTNSGVVAKDQNHLVDILDGLHKEFTENGKIKCSSIDVELYSRQVQVQKFAELLHSLK